MAVPLKHSLKRVPVVVTSERHLGEVEHPGCSYCFRKRHQETDFCDSEEEGIVPRPRLKRLFRVSLRSLLVVTTAFCVWLGMKVTNAERQKEAVAWVKKLGGTVIYEHEYRSISDMLSGKTPRLRGPKWLRDTVGEDLFVTPFSVQILDSPVGDLSQLKYLPMLRHLSLRIERDTDISPLAELQDLRTLALVCPDGCDVSVLMDLKQLKGLLIEGVTRTQLSELRTTLPDCCVTDTFSPGTSY